MWWFRKFNSSLILISTVVYSISASRNSSNKVAEESVMNSSFKRSFKNNVKDNVYSTTTYEELVTTKEPILPEWGGNCTKKDWDKCSKLKRWVTSYLKDKKRPELGYKYHELDCKVQPILCLKNGWTVTRCQLLCMRCNKELISKYDKYVDKEGAC